MFCGKTLSGSTGILINVAHVLKVVIMGSIPSLSKRNYRKEKFTSWSIHTLFFFFGMPAKGAESKGEPAHIRKENLHR